MHKPTPHHKALKHGITFTEIAHFAYQVFEGHGLAMLLPAALAILFTVAFLFGDE